MRRVGSSVLLLLAATATTATAAIAAAPVGPSKARSAPVYSINKGTTRHVEVKDGGIYVVSGSADPTFLCKQDATFTVANLKPHAYVPSFTLPAKPAGLKRQVTDRTGGAVLPPPERTSASTVALGNFADPASRWRGWTFKANSLTNGIWTCNPNEDPNASCRTDLPFDIYTTYFRLRTDQTVNGTYQKAVGAVGPPYLPDGYVGNSQADLFTNGWRVGDRIIGVAYRYPDNLAGTDYPQSSFMGVDFDGVTFRPSSAVGVNDGNTKIQNLSHSYLSTNAKPVSWLVRQTGPNPTELNYNVYPVPRSLAQPVPAGVSPNITTATYIYWAYWNKDFVDPVRTFIVRDPTGNRIVQEQRLFNMDATIRNRFGEGDYGPQTLFTIVPSKDNGYPAEYTVFNVPQSKFQDQVTLWSSRTYSCAVDRKTRNVTVDLVA